MVEQSIPRGHFTELVIQLSRSTTVRAGADRAIEPGSNVGVRWRRALVYDGDHLALEPTELCGTSMSRGRLRLGSADRPLAVAHRGEPRGHRENTLPSVAAALRAGADVVEIDAKVSADGVPVLLHDRSLERLWGEDTDVAALAATELASRVSSDGGIPTLQEALAIVSGTGTTLLIDLDDPAWAPASLAVVVGARAAGWLERDEVLWCGRPDALDVVRAADPDARIVLSWDADTDGGLLPGDDVVERLQPESFNPSWLMMDAAAVAWARERGLAATCWTVDDAVQMGSLLDLGVDAIITNTISVLRRVIDDRVS